MKRTVTILLAVSALAGCKKSLEPERRAAWTSYADAKCKCANKGDLDEARRCLAAIGKAPSILSAGYDDEASAFLDRAYAIAMDCDRDIRSRR